MTYNRSLTKLASIAIVIGAFFLLVFASWDGNQLELVALLPALLVFGGCLAMHFLLHGRAGAHGHGDVEPAQTAERDPNPKGDLK